MDATERDTWRRADALFGQLMDLPPPERQRRLDTMDEPDSLRQRVQRMLDALGDTGGGILDHPERLGGMLQVDALAGRCLGRWRLDREIGRGGMAVVYRASSTAGPEGQAAAIKVLTLGALAGHGSRQFLREQASLLRLRHPYIVPLLDAGVADDGTPWLAMALVEGERVDNWCEQRGSGIADRVKLTLQVCEAVAHAHRNLVIHRDIKPSNVLVDEDGRVRLLDFGIAHASDAGREPTMTALRALTPGYAAPEQVAGAPPTTAMDIHGLGALLYRLLCGKPPTAGAAGKPAPPSRAADPAVGRLLRGDLDVIAMKALAERPEQRYATVEALGEDLERWLDGRMVRARPPSAGYRLRKFVGRNKGLATASVALLLVLGAGVAATLWQAGIARQQAARAQEEAERSQAQLDYLNSVLGVLAPGTEATRELDRHEMIAEAARRARAELAGRPGLLASVELSLGDIARRTGDYRQAHALFGTALATRGRQEGTDSLAYGAALLALGAVTGKIEPFDQLRAEQRLRQAVDLFGRHDADPALLVNGLIEHAAQLAVLGRFETARRQLERATELCGDAGSRDASCDRVWLALGSVERRVGNVPEAVAAYSTLLALRRDHFGEYHARTAVAYGKLGHALVRKGELQRGLGLLEHARDLSSRTNATPSKDTLQILCDLAEAYLVANRSEEALELFSRYLDGARELFGEQSETFAYGLGQVGSLHHRNGRFAQAAEAWRRSHEIYSRLLGPSAPTTAYALGRYADSLSALGRASQALPLAERALDLHREAFGEDSARTGARWSHLGNILFRLGHYERAMEAFGRAGRILRAAPATDIVRQRIFVTRSQVGRTLFAMGKQRQGLAEARIALAEAEALGDRSSSFYGSTLANLAELSCRSTQARDCDRLLARARREARSTRLSIGSRKRLEQVLEASVIGPAMQAGR